MMEDTSKPMANKECVEPIKNSGWRSWFSLRGIGSSSQKLHEGVETSLTVTDNNGGVSKDNNFSQNQDSSCPVDVNTRSRWKSWFGGTSPHSKNNPMLQQQTQVRTSQSNDNPLTNTPSKQLDGCTSSELMAENLMFAENQKPHPNQKIVLETNRVTASIPRSTTQENSGKFYL